MTEKTIKNKIIRTRVSEDLKTEFIKAADSNGLNESEFLRLVIIAIVANNKTNKSPLMNENDFERKVISLWLPNFIIEAAKAKAESYGMSLTTWIKSLVQSNIIAEPVLFDDALIAVKESNRELASIGNNLNQIARRLNESVFKTELVRLEKLEEVITAVKSLRAELKRLIRLSQNSWGIDNE
jgi:antitoxin component of RelBE/YafQ-DinJ toxin-antitoxin module